MGLRAEIEEDLAETLEDLDDFGMPVILIAPDGSIQTKSANDSTLDLSGQVLYDTFSQDEDGVRTVDHKPIVSLRRSSLDRVPQHGEKWAIRVPESPISGASLVTYVMERAPLDGRSMGFIRMILRSTEQWESEMATEVPTYSISTVLTEVTYEGVHRTDNPTGDIKLTLPAITELMLGKSVTLKKWGAGNCHFQARPGNTIADGADSTFVVRNSQPSEEMIAEITLTAVSLTEWAWGNIFGSWQIELA